MRAVLLLLILRWQVARRFRSSPLVRAEVGVAFDRTARSPASPRASPIRGRAARVTPDDPARVASVSKLVVAIGVMKLVEAGKLDLDRDVSRYLGWPLAQPALPRPADHAAMLLVHTSSVREHDDNYVLPLGASLQAAMQDPLEWDAATAPATIISPTPT